MNDSMVKRVSKWKVRETKTEKRAERIRHQVEPSGLDDEQGRESVTISIGISSLSPKNDRPDMFVLSADRALYNAKVRGGNQIAVG